MVLYIYSNYSKISLISKIQIHYPIHIPTKYHKSCNEELIDEYQIIDKFPNICTYITIKPQNFNFT